MRIYLLSYISIFLFLVLVGCGSSKNTQMMGSLKKEGLTSRKYQKVAIVLIAPKINSRAIVEQELALAFNEKGIKAIPTYSIFPFAGTQEVVREAYSDPDEFKAFVRKRIYDNNIDAIMIISLFDIQKEQRYVETGGITVGVAVSGYGNTNPYFDPNVPAYNYPYWGYFDYAVTRVNSEGYYQTTTTYFLESNLYDVQSEELLWTGQTKSTPESLSEESLVYANMLVEEILEKAVLKP
jgi:hypothetical protein